MYKKNPLSHVYDFGDNSRDSIIDEVPTTTVALGRPVTQFYDIASAEPSENSVTAPIALDRPVTQMYDLGSAEPSDTVNVEYDYGHEDGHVTLRNSPGQGHFRDSFKRVPDLETLPVEGALK